MAAPPPQEVKNKFNNGDMIRKLTEGGRMIRGAALSECIFCQIATSSASTTLLHSDDKVVAFRDINPSAFRHYLVIPKQHIPTVKNLQRSPEDFSLVSHMLDVGKSLLHRDAPQCKHYRFGFHQPPFNSVDHLHLHCFALPYTPSWRFIKYLSLGPLGGFVEAEKLLERIKPQIPHHSSM
ncbi:bifunctional adenosine 5'-phosphosulfate phosphorylase/adenylylsulfatase HINT4 [Nicotiana tabacum]|uniref:Histidine triad nucleotide-binding protein 3 n=1 Tax=Nicotiana tabacum TaxID=4097 RepID=A0A1S4AH91_TOBAC|nr:PREDICTED: histidine triad nucleotide-binding protein 3-like [Nicotiana tabacum]XP_016475799.1 PREDICTED: histidine triad nucleotide-binding protein 3-like [Nicotiana tabacum]